MTTNPTITAYELLLYTIRNARSISAEKKRSYIERIERNEWPTALRLELKALCEAEAALRSEDAEMRKRLIVEQQQGIAEAAPEADLQEESVMQDFRGTISSIGSTYTENCNAVERGLAREIETSARSEEGNVVADIRNFLKQDAGDGVDA
ncbi:MAG TPA: hypothetical protein PKV72_02745 [Candidatus Peribacteria bacterium]|nr:hypothetical protein [Candidatus Peribacteria bacterium]